MILMKVGKVRRARKIPRTEILRRAQGKLGRVFGGTIVKTLKLRVKVSFYDEEYGLWPVTIFIRVNRVDQTVGLMQFNRQGYCQRMPSPDEIRDQIEKINTKAS